MVVLRICSESPGTCLLMPHDRVLLCPGEVTKLTFVLDWLLVLLLLTVDPLLVVLQGIFSECLIVTLIALEILLVVLFLVAIIESILLRKGKERG